MTHTFVSLSLFNDVATRPAIHSLEALPLEPSASDPVTGDEERTDAVPRSFCGKWSAAILRRGRR